MVAEAIDRRTGERVAVKKLHSLFSNPIEALRGLRELRIVRSLAHDNILPVLDIMRIPGEDMETFDSIYLVTELMDADLAQIVGSSQDLTDLHLAYFVYQLTKALVYLHSANVVHRDLKPANCLLNGDSLLKMADFGLAKADATNDVSNPAMTAYVVTRYYRAPEVILTRTAGGEGNYGKAVDMWALGMILAELITRSPLLPGKHENHQIKLILDLTGTPDEDYISTFSPEVASFLREYDAPPKEPFQNYFPQANPDAVDLIERLLRFNPAERLTAIQVLDHPFLQDVRDPETEVIATAPLDMGVDYYSADLSLPTLRQLIYNEMLFFHPEMGSFDPFFPSHDLFPATGFNDNASHTEGQGEGDMLVGTPLGGDNGGLGGFGGFGGGSSFGEFGGTMDVASPLPEMGGGGGSGSSWMTHFGAGVSIFDDDLEHDPDAAVVDMMSPGY